MCIRQSISFWTTRSIRVSIASDWLYDAMLELPKTQRETLILEFWYGYGDQEIAAYFHVTPRTIYNWRQKAFTAIRKYYERNGDERK